MKSNAEIIFEASASAASMLGQIFALAAILSLGVFVLWVLVQLLASASAKKGE